VLIEVAKPVAFILCVVSLYALFIHAFLLPSNDMHEKICDCLSLLMLAAGMSLISGLIFQRATPGQSMLDTQLLATLPVQLFCWASSTMLILFLVSWYLESHCIFYRDVNF
jgi:hypothetical protein